MDTSQECSKQMEMKTKELVEKDQKLSSLAENVNALTDEKNNIVQQADGDKV